MVVVRRGHGGQSWKVAIKSPRSQFLTKKDDQQATDSPLEQREHAGCTHIIAIVESSLLPCQVATVASPSFFPSNDVHASTLAAIGGVSQRKAVPGLKIQSVVSCLLVPCASLLRVSQRASCRRGRLLDRLNVSCACAPSTTEPLRESATNGMTDAPAKWFHDRRGICCCGAPPCCVGSIPSSPNGTQSHKQFPLVSEN